MKIRQTTRKLRHGARKNTSRLRIKLPGRLRDSNTLQWIKRMLRGAIMCAMILVSACLFYVLIIMGDTYDASATPQGNASVQLMDLPYSPMELDANAIKEAQQYFNAPIMRLAGNTKWRLEGIIVQDEQPPGVGMMIREVRLQYIDDATGSRVNVSSLTPSRYLRGLTSRGLSAVAQQQGVMANMRAVIMSDGALLHAHAQDGESVYQIEGNVSDEEMRSAMASAALIR